MEIEIEIEIKIIFFFVESVAQNNVQTLKGILQLSPITSTFDATC